MSERVSVSELISRRLAGERDDYVLALSVDGGGLRGVVTGAMLLALRDLELLHVFDRFYGCSAGALNLAIIMAGGSWPSLSMYFDEIRLGFIPRRRRSVSPVVDMEFLRKLLYRHLMFHDVARLESVDFRFLVTDVDERSAEIVSARGRSADELVDLLIAGAWLPVLAGSVPQIDGRRLCDGYILEPHTFRSAMLDGATHALSLSTSLVSRGGNARRSWTAAAVALDSVRLGLGRSYLKSRKMAVLDCHHLTMNEDAAWHNGSVLVVGPKDKEYPLPLAASEARLLAGARAGYAVVFGRDWHSPN